MEFKGTKGKWRVKNIDDKVLIVDDNLNRIAISDTFNSFEEDTYNSLLISKAPEMLEMLIDAVNENKNGEPLSKAWFNAVERIITEATEL